MGRTMPKARRKKENLPEGHILESGPLPPAKASAQKQLAKDHCRIDRIEVSLIILHQIELYQKIRQHPPIPVFIMGSL